MDALTCLKTRRSIRAYEDRQVDEALLAQVLEAGMYAPTGMGRQSPKMVVVQDRATRDQLSRMNAAVMNSTGDPFYGAPTVILVSAAAEELEDVRYCNAACIVENMHLAATDLGLGSVYLLGCTRALLKAPALQRELGVPEGFVPMSALAVGFASQEVRRRELTAERIAVTRMP